MPVLDAYNYSLLSVPAVWLLGIGTHWSAIYLSTVSREIPKFDNVSPRQYVAEIAKLAKTSKVSPPSPFQNLADDIDVQTSAGRSPTVQDRGGTAEHL